MAYKTDKIQVYIDMDGVLCDFVKRYNEMKIFDPEVAYPQSQWGFFSKLEPMPMAIESYKILKNRGYDVKILTRPSTKNLNCYSEKADWVRTYLGEPELENLMFACDKSYVKGLNGYLIDDSTLHGQSDFEGEHLHFGIDEQTGEEHRFPNWDSILDYLPSRTGGESIQFNPPLK